MIELLFYNHLLRKSLLGREEKKTEEAAGVEISNGD